MLGQGVMPQGWQKVVKQLGGIVHKSFPPASHQGIQHPSKLYVNTGQTIIVYAQGTKLT